MLQSGDMGSSNGTSYGNLTGSGPTMTASGSGIGGAMPTQSVAGTNDGVSGIEAWSATAVLGVGLVAMAMAAI